MKNKVDRIQAALYAAFFGLRTGRLYIPWNGSYTLCSRVLCAVAWCGPAQHPDFSGGTGHASMMIEFSIVPLGSGASVSPVIARVLRIVMDSGVRYKANPMGTVVEGEWGELIGLIRQCHEEALKDAERVVTTIKIDDYPAKGNRLDTKLESVEQKLGVKLKR
jgi:uncharacterized protein (TIGR00106 family)